MSEAEYATISGISWRYLIPKAVLRSNLAPFILPRRQVFAVLCSAENRVATYDCRRGNLLWERIFLQKYGLTQETLLYSNHGNWLIIACVNCVFLLDSRSGDTIAEFRFLHCVQKGITFSPCDTKLAICGCSLTVAFALNAPENQKGNNFFHSEPLWWKTKHESRQACFSPCSHFLAFGNRTISLHCVESGQLCWKSHDLLNTAATTLTALNFSNDGHRINAIFSNGHSAFSVKFLNAGNGTILKTLILDAVPTFSPDRNQIVLYHPSLTLAPSQASILQVDTLDAVAILDSCYPGSLTFSPCQNNSNCLIIWNAAPSRPVIARFLSILPRRIRHVGNPTPSPPLFSIDTPQSRRRHGDVYDKRNYIITKPESTTSSVHVCGSIILDETPFSTVFSPDGSIVALQLGRYLALFDVPTGQEQMRIPVNALPSCSEVTVAWHPNGLSF